ncbi:MAG TPA: hypothetical protein VLY63_28960 [Anaerolineae bacterium]|nr:hypothetical protein [Anaerolineae bacterium]
MRLDQRRSSKMEIFEIRVQGGLDAQWSDWFDGLAILPQDNGETVLSGPVRDQAALHGLLNKIRDLGLPLLSVHQVAVSEND